MSQILILESIEFIEKKRCLVPPPPPIKNMQIVYWGEFQYCTIILVKNPYVTKVLEQ